MKVRELIEALQRCDPDDPVEIACTFGPHGREWFRENIASVGRHNTADTKPVVLVSNQNLPLVLG